MRILRNFLIAIAVLFLALAALAAGGMRVMRGKFEKPTAVQPGVWSIHANGVYFYGLKYGAKVVLIDSGIDPRGRPVDALLQAMEQGPSDVSDVLVTHGHPDHTQGAVSLAHAKIYIGEADVALAGGASAPGAVLPKILGILMPPTPLTPTDLIRGSPTLSVGDGVSIRAVPMPGHTAGSYAFFVDGVLYVGDTMMCEGGKLAKPAGPFDFNSDANKKAVVALKTYLKDVQISRVCVSHGDCNCTAAGQGQAALDAIIKQFGG